MTKILAIIGIVLITLLFNNTSYANLGATILLDRQAELSDLVIIGKAHREVACRLRGQEHLCLELNEVSVIRRNGKFRVGNSLWIILDTQIEELKVECCEIGRSYLVFINKNGGLYLPFFGQKSFVQLSN